MKNTGSYNQQGEEIMYLHFDFFLFSPLLQGKEMWNLITAQTCMI